MFDEELGVQFSLERVNAKRFRTKASAWRGLVAALKHEELFDTVLAEVPPPVATLLSEPPRGGVFVPAIAFHFVYRALEGKVDDARMRAIGQRSMHRGSIPVLKPVLEALLRLLGTNPGAVLRRMPPIITGQVKGMTVAVTGLHEHEATVHVAYEYISGLPRTSFSFWQGILWTVFDLCHTEPREATMEIDEARASCVYHFAWD